MSMSGRLSLIQVLILPWAVSGTIFHPTCTVPSDTVNFVNFSNVRGTLDIVWSCLFTILVCSWAIQYPNIRVQVPQSAHWSQSFKKSIETYRSKAVWMLVTILSPEYMLGLALQDFMRGLRSVREMEAWAREDGVPWTLTHARYANMGGITFRVEGDYFQSDTPSPTNGSTISLISLERIYETIKDRNRFTLDSPMKLEIRNCDDSKDMKIESSIQEIDIGDQRMDHGWHDVRTSSQSSALSQSETLQSYQAQICRPVSTRTSFQTDNDDKIDAISNPAIKSDTKRDIGDEEKREDSNSTYSSMAPYQMYPYADQLRLLRECEVIEHLPDISESEIADDSKGDTLMKIIAIVQVSYLIISLITRAIKHLPMTLLEIATVAFSACAFIAYVLFYSKPQDIAAPTDACGSQLIWGEDLNRISGRIRYFNAFTDIRGFYLPWWPWNDSILAPPKLDFGWHEGPSFGIYNGEQYLRYIQIGITLAGTILGGFHCLAWSFEFPSSAERVIWRVSSLAATSSLPLLLLARVYFPLIDRLGGANLGKYQYCFDALPFLINVSYVIARFCLTALVVRSLFYLPPKAFIATWAP